MSRPVRLGLTGSIGMGKSTTAKIFAGMGCDVWDADAAVHRLYGRHGAAVGGIAAMRPEAVIDGAVSREKLKEWISADAAALKRIEALVHPLVAADRAGFLARSKAPIVVFDIPLLFENGTEREMDAVAVVSAPAEIQRKRVLARPGMTEATLDMILSRQMPDAEKRARADYVIETVDIDTARAQVRAVIDDLEARHA